MIKPAKRIGLVKRIKDSYMDRGKFLCLHKNERTYEFSPSFVRGLKKIISSSTLNMYPEIQPLYIRLAKWLNLTPEEVYISAGSEYGIKAVCETYLQPKDRVLLHSPSYALMDIYVRLSGAKILTQEFCPDLSFNFNSYIKKIKPNIKMVVLENPNGFVGNGYNLYKVEQFVKRAHKCNVLAVVDEAYYHFHDVTVANLVRKYNNLIVLRTFSKAFGAAGIRMGYLIACKRIIDNINKVQPMHEISHYTLLSAIYLLDHIKEMKRHAAEIKRNRKFVVNNLLKLGIPCCDTTTNFILVKWPIHDDIQAEFKRRGILIRRPFKQSFLRGWSRIGIGNRKQMKQFLDAVDSILKQQ